MRKLIILAVASAMLLGAACNTIAGVGRDAQSAGKTVSKAAKQ
ncbi:entericidin A/B family lipoprotein [Phenylobacterium sp.]|nr:entericidin A/B family lipoprotein [Phenylobacterium sp.]